MTLDPGAGIGIPVLLVHDLDAGGRQRWQQHLVQAGVLIVHQAGGALMNRRQLIGDRQSVRTGLSGPELQQLLQAGDPDLEEFVQVTG